ncbi:hypothetical protein B0I35DRAFT_465989 [Stachybotrys elegans]|uniref:ubiquitinyl hydrolase 1 n=1 Tax=Stachybotrys elegans TaxID=80388 RepID=A0A8K0SXA5_9HYPO|nr:hypothetical protein B0I35DRAFT_465989 [Stachybotrys elegans]
MEKPSQEAKPDIVNLLYNHLVLPPKLPHREDPNIAQVETALLDRLIEASKSFSDEAVTRSLKASRSIRPNGRLDRTALIRELESLDEDMFLVIYVTCQNSGLFIRRSHDKHLGPAIIFEAYEASAKNEDILAAENAMQWSFPGSAVAVSLTTFHDPGFIQNLATFLENAAREAPKDFAAHAFKAGTTVFEYRNTPEPVLITSMLMAILQENGRRLSPPLLQKMVRDDVCWSKADRPWRRLPFWLVLRVAIGRYFADILGGEVGRVEYKFLLLELLTTFLDEAHCSDFPNPLQDAERSEVSVEQLAWLRTKICRRLVKLDVDKTHCQDPKVTLRIDELYGKFNKKFSGSVQRASNFIGAKWRQQKMLMSKSIPELPRLASERDTHMQLDISGKRIHDILNGFTRPRKRPEPRSMNFTEAANRHRNKLSYAYMQLFDLEAECMAFCQSEDPSEFDSDEQDAAEETCEQAAKLIRQYLNSLKSPTDSSDRGKPTMSSKAQQMPPKLQIPPLFYSGDSEQSSILILTVMELWVKFDKAACQVHPLIREFHPIFHASQLDVIQLTRYRDMKRLQQVQLYLKDRLASCSSPEMTIFDEPQKGCFGHRYYEESPESESLKALYAAIEEAASAKREAKRAEWKEKSRRYVELSTAIDRSTCTYEIDDLNPLGRGIHHPRCPRCQMISQQSGLRIKIYEHPLPSDMIVAKTVVFELACPEIFSLYREVTWFVLSGLALPGLEASHRPKCLLKGYDQLQQFNEAPDSTLTLASTTKSFLYTHYSTLDFPVEWDGGKDSVCRPNGLKLAYFDGALTVWPSRQRPRPTFLHHIKLSIPNSSPFTKLLRIPAFQDFTYGPSSYEVISTASSCPSGINVHEYLAFQTIASGKARRWIAILTELASVNLNFSNEATSVLLNALATQCGPMSEDGDPMRVNHAIFRDEAFCTQLMAQLSERLASLATNWRENALMDTVITVTLRLAMLAFAANMKDVSAKAFKLLKRARTICATWFKALRKEIRRVEDTTTAQRSQLYALWAGLLCKRTFTLHDMKSTLLDGPQLEVYIQSCVTIQENLAASSASLPKLLQHAIARDYRISHAVRDLVSESIMSYPQALASAIDSMWFDEGGEKAVVTEMKKESRGWISCIMKSSEEGDEQVLGYNYVDGLILINGHPINKLPKDPKGTVTLNALFGNQALMTFPSDKNGMQYKLCVCPYGYSVHVGYDHTGEMIVRAWGRGCVLQYLPQHYFGDHKNCDLPGPLVNRKFHWLNLRTGEIYIAPEERRWPNLSGGFRGWTLNVHKNLCTKPRGLVADQAVSPYSPLFARAAGILEPLEGRAHMLITQGHNRHVQVELPRLQLVFYVNSKRLLESPQLQVEIDPNQDAGTWYGLRTKLVCRALNNGTLNNSPQRSILVPLGETHIEAHRCHVRVWNEQTGVYGKFLINPLLEQIDCAPEPGLIYTKALMHACTSSHIPDALTGRTGTEEAIHWLQSGICQPWAPLPPIALQKLQHLARLSPRRVYYPQDLKVMKTDWYDPAMPVMIQDSRLRPIVDAILNTSRTLNGFAPTDYEYPVLETPGPFHLHRRTIIRQEALERCLGDAEERSQPLPWVYQARHFPSSSGPSSSGPLSSYPPSSYPSSASSPSVSSAYRRVLEITNAIRAWPQEMKTTSSLAQSLTTNSFVGPFTEIFAKASLNDRMKTDIVQAWGSLVRYAQACEEPYSLMYLMAAISFSDVDMGLLKTLVAFAVFDELRNIPLPEWEDYVAYNPTQVLHQGFLVSVLKNFQTQPEQDASETFGNFMNSKQLKKVQLMKARHEMQADEDTQYVAKFLLRQWPCPEPSVEGLERAVLLELGPALEAVRAEWKRLYQNLALTNHLEAVQEVLSKRFSDTEYVPPAFVRSEDAYPTRLRGHDLVDLNMLLHKPAVEKHQPCLAELNGHPPSAIKNGWGMPIRNHYQQENMREGPRITHIAPLMNKAAPISRVALATPIMDLHDIIERLKLSKSSVKKRYAADLQQSLGAFQRLKQSSPANRGGIDRLIGVSKRDEFVKVTQAKIQSALDHPSDVMSPERIQWLKAGGLWPITSKSAVLARLRSTSTQKNFGGGMRELIIELGVSITELQREVRLRELGETAQVGRKDEELNNKGHSNWSPEEYPDWLLLEIESNMMIRPIQVDVALATISPATGNNSVLQMNMGQGKTSCIIPMVAAALADKKRLVRVVVPKALMQQTAQILMSRLGRILNRQIRHVPFSRRTDTAEHTIRSYAAIHQDMRGSAGIMLCQPEHNLSFMLSGLQKLLDNQVPQAKSMLKFQASLEKTCRDILDESDYTLAVRTQLIYPSGSQMTVDGHPHRWQIVQSMLRLIDAQMMSLAPTFRNSVEVVRRPGGGFPLIFFLRQDVEDELVRRVTNDICQGLGGILPMNSTTLTQKQRVAVKDFISWPKPRTQSVTAIRTMCPDQPSIRSAVYLLRGLLVNRILMMTLKKRWNVQYGLHPQRDPIAVPFHAKGVPSEQSEWGHPDVAIVFTCLAFYYDGLNTAQLRQCLEHVLKSDDPSTEYDRWTHSTENFPSSLKAWNSINVEDEVQLSEIWAVVRYNMVVIDYFLNNFVFPRHAKQFKVKLQSNGWDIPLFPLEESLGEGPAKMKPLTTGFSGTNDNRVMLPLTIKQEDLPSLSHTSAEVLTYLLQPRNRHCVLPYQLTANGGQGERQRATETDLLRKLKELHIRVLIDAGAQILEMSNFALAQEWLKIDQNALGALYFDEGNRPWVLSRMGNKTPLLASPFADDLSKCLVYLDEAHTRGTDLKLPPEAKGALTLGLGQTKDHTVQAAMRLRQLGTTQSVCFFIPPEVHQSIADLQNVTMAYSIDSRDVVQWLLHNTCEGIEQLQPLYYSQGIDYCRRMQASLDHPDIVKDKRHREAFISEVKQEEQQTLQQLYEPKAKSRATILQASSNTKLNGFIKELNERRKTFQDTGKAVHASALQEVEQEREVAFEVESVRQVKKPLQYPAHAFPGLHETLESFARTGRLAAGSSYFTSVFGALAKTGLGRRFRVSRDARPARLYVSAEFERTVKVSTDATGDNFIRCVNWILWSPVISTAVIIIPEEAEALLPMMRDRSIHKETYLLTYSAPTTRKMTHFDDLKFYSIPSLPEDWEAPDWLRLELGLFAGRLYFEWQDYEAICELIGVEQGSSQDLMAELALELEDLDLEEPGEDNLALESRKDMFVSKPLTFLQEWIALRRRGQDFAHSPMGFVTQGKVLEEGHVFFRRVQDYGGQEPGPLASMATVAKYQETDEYIDYHGVDDMGANEAADSDAEDDEVVYDKSEWSGREIAE